MRFLLAAILLQVALAARWQDLFLYNIDFACDDNMRSIYRVESRVAPDEYRTWRFACRTNPTGQPLGQYKYYDRVSLHQKPFSFKCKNGGMMTGFVTSTYDKTVKDRQFRFKCYSVNGFEEHTDCQVSPWTDYDGNIDYIAPDGFVIVGIQSEYSSVHMSRRFKFDACKLQPKSNLG